MVFLVVVVASDPLRVYVDEQIVVDVLDVLCVDPELVRDATAEFDPVFVAASFDFVKQALFDLCGCLRDGCDLYESPSKRSRASPLRIEHMRKNA